jgi:hypothetical protein
LEDETGAGNLSSDNHPWIMIIEPQTSAPGTAHTLLKRIAFVNGQPEQLNTAEPVRVEDRLQ